MTTEPGVEGQTFIPESLEKIRRLREKLNQMGLDTDIEVDGNITKENIGAVAAAGAIHICIRKSNCKGKYGRKYPLDAAGNPQRERR